MTTQTCRAKLSPPPSCRQTPKKALSPSKELEQLIQQKQNLMDAAQQNEFQIRRLYNSGSANWPAAQQLFEANKAIGRELIPTNNRIRELERLG